MHRKLGLAGDLAGHSLADVTRQLVPAEQREDEETLSALLTGRAARDAEITNRGASVALRAIPLSRAGEHRGAVVLLRDVTELRRRDRELLTKDATIREIHHRVKNNLQTVAALLRLQSRRIGSQDGRFALDEAVRRVGAIALVHEVLSQTHEESVEFDLIADQLARLVLDVGARGAGLRISREGSFGLLASEVATPLAMVLTELLQNALEHGVPESGHGHVVVRVDRTDRLAIEVADGGPGWPEGFVLGEGNSLGMSIVHTLVTERGGQIDHGIDAALGGAVVRVVVPLE